MIDMLENLMDETPTGLEIREVREEELEATKKMVSRAFFPDREDEQLPEFFNQLDHISIPSSEFFRAGFIDGAPVTAVMAVRFMISIGIVPFKIAGYTGMGTDKEARGKGYATQLIKEFGEFLDKKGYEGIVLHSGADMLYKKSGFEMVFGQGSFNVSPDNIDQYVKAQMKNYRNRSFNIKTITKLEELPQIVEITRKISEINNIFYQNGFNVIKTKKFWQEYINYLFSKGFYITILTESHDVYSHIPQKQKVIAYMIYKIEQIKEIAGKPEEVTEDADEKPEQQNEDADEKTEEQKEDVDEKPEEKKEVKNTLKIFEFHSTEHSTYVNAMLINMVLDEAIHSAKPIGEIEGMYQNRRSDLKDLIERCNGDISLSLISKNFFHIINMPAFMKKLEPELFRRLEETGKLHNSVFVVKIVESETELLFRIENNVVSVFDVKNVEPDQLPENCPRISIENEGVYALIFGTYDPTDVLEDCEVENIEKTELISILSALFPFTGPIWPSIYYY